MKLVTRRKLISSMPKQEDINKSNRKDIVKKRKEYVKARNKEVRGLLKTINDGLKTSASNNYYSAYLTISIDERMYWNIEIAVRYFRMHSNIRIERVLKDDEVTYYFRWD